MSTHYQNKPMEMEKVQGNYEKKYRDLKVQWFNRV